MNGETFKDVDWLFLKELEAYLLEINEMLFKRSIPISMPGPVFLVW